jgi:hypothetical protein
MADWITAVEKLEEEIRDLENDIKYLRKDNLVKAELIAELMLENKELSKRPAVYIAKNPFGTMFMTGEEPQLFLSIENAKKWFATVPIYDVEFEPYTGENERALDND